MDTRNFEKVSYNTQLEWSNTRKAKIIVCKGGSYSNISCKFTNWNIPPMSNKFEYSSKIFNKCTTK